MPRRPAVTVSIPGLPPSLWQAYATRKGGGRCLSRKAREWQEEAALYALRARPKKPFAGHLRLEVSLMSRDHRRWDVDNRAKVLLDLFTQLGFWGDDSQVWELNLRRIMGEKNLTTVRIEPLRRS